MYALEQLIKLLNFTQTFVMTVTKWGARKWARVLFVQVRTWDHPQVLQTIAPHEQMVRQQFLLGLKLLGIREPNLHPNCNQCLYGYEMCILP